ncbi:Ubiquitin carboxyl-terminal hydrolase 26 [Mortierella sp. AD031]|nr:Ubiquitin carboxyl-terminal hydrolase 26 [Mortierella sp. AD031]
MTSDNIESTSRPALTQDHRLPDSFHGFVHVVDVERESLSRKFENVRCWLACDDTASVNFYLDPQKELDYIQFRMTHSIRQVYFSNKTGTIKLHLSTQKRLDITLDAVENGQRLYDHLARIKARPNDCDDFPRHQPKVGIVKPDASSAYLTVNDAPSDFAPFTVEKAEPSTPTRKRASQYFVPATESEHTSKKTRAVIHQSLFSSYRQSKEVLDSVLSTSPPVPQPTPEKWQVPSSPIYKDLETITPNRKQIFDKFERFGYTTPQKSEPVPRPQFHASVPTPRVLRSMNDRTKRYGREQDHRSARDSGVLEKSSGSRCINAVVQAMIPLIPVARDLTDSYWLLICGVENGLFRSFVDMHTAYSNSKTNNLKIQEEVVSNNIVKSSPGSLGGEVDDAREFLNDCLNQVRKEFLEQNDDFGCPIYQMFRGDIDHVSVCVNCGNETYSSESHQDFRLEVPDIERSGRFSHGSVSIGGLVPQLFDTREIAAECEKCHSDRATVHRSFSKLPEVLVLCLKRFSSKPTRGFNKNRGHVTIDATLEFTQFCNAEAFTRKAGPATYNPGDFGMRPHIPSDSLPSSSSSPFSSVSPRRQHDLFHTPPPPDRRVTKLDDDDPFRITSAENPIVLDSDDDDIYDITASQSFYEEPSEEEQYQWAMEESIRASQSQSLSQVSVLDEKWTVGTTDDGSKGSSRIFGESNPYAYADFASRIRAEDDVRSESESQRTNDRSSRASTPKPCPKLEQSDRKDIFVVHEDKEKGTDRGSINNDKGMDRGSINNDKGKDGGGGGDDADEEDEDIKAALLASLLPENTASLTEKDIQEQEKKQVEEAIKRSLLDQEENKENISPDKAASRKKMMEKKKLAALARSCSQLERLTSDKHHRHESHQQRKRPMAQLKRASTIDCIDRNAFSRSDGLGSYSQPYSISQSPSPTETSSQPIHLDFPDRTRLIDSATTRHQDRDEQPYSRSNGSVGCLDDAEEDDDMTLSRRVTRAFKGKDRVPPSLQTQTEDDDQSLGLFQLQAVVSHTGLSMSSSSPAAAQGGHYVCDRLGTDGIWRCHDGAKVTKLGSISDLTRNRARSGYLFFYVRCHPGSQA